MGITTQGFGQEGYVLDSSDVGPLPKPPEEALNFATGVPYYLPFATPYRDSWEIYRDDPITVTQLISMRRRDGQARALFRLLTKPILASIKHADVIPRDGVTGGTEEAQFCKDLLFLPKSAGGMTHSFTRFVKQMLLALFAGFSAWEMVYWQPKTGPLAGKFTLRKIDWRPSETLTFLLDGQGEFCYCGEVQVEQLNGTSVRIDEMVRRHQEGQEQWVYSCTEDGKVVPGKVKDARKTSDSEPLVEVQLDNGEKVKCTLTHPWMLRDGTYRRASQLQPGDSLMPLYRRRVSLGVGRKDYEQVWHPGRGKWEFTHRMVARNLGFAARRGYVIHHWFNGLCQLNNDPRNLERMTLRAHQQLHADLGHLRHSDVTFRDIDQVACAVVEAGKRLTWEVVAEKLGCSPDVIYDRIWDAGYESWKQYKWSLTQAAWKKDRKYHRRKELRAGGVADGRRVPVTFRDIDQVAREIAETGRKFGGRDVTEALGCDLTVLYTRIRAQGFAGWEDYRRTLVPPGRPGKGHSSGVVFADIIRLCQETIAAGDGVPGAIQASRALGCGTAVLYACVRAEGFAGWKDYKASLTQNHKVVAVRFDVEPEAVYDIEVEGHHNFALTAGVFVHNSGFRQRTFFQGRTIDVKIEKDVALYYAHDEAERPFYGISMFESAFYHYDKKEKLYYIAHLAAQRAAVGLRVGTMVPNAPPADKNNFIKALAQLGLAQYIAVPSADWTVQTLNETASRFDFLGLINHHNSQMSKSVLAQWFDDAQGGGSGAGQGDSTLVDFGKQNDVTFMMMLEGILEEMAEVINNEIFPRFVDWNFTGGKYPKFKWGALTAEQKAAIQDTFDKLAVAGQSANVTPEFMLELEQHMSEDMSFNIDYDKIKKEREKQAKLMAQQAQQAMAGGGGPPGQGPPPQAGQTAGQTAGGAVQPMPQPAMAGASGGGS